MSGDPKFVFVRGPVTVLVDGQELGSEPAEVPAPGSVNITRTATFVVEGGGDVLDFYMMIEPERMKA